MSVSVLLAELKYQHFMGANDLLYLLDDHLCIFPVCHLHSVPLNKLAVFLYRIPGKLRNTVRK